MKAVILGTTAGAFSEGVKRRLGSPWQVLATTDAAALADADALVSVGFEDTLARAPRLKLSRAPEQARNGRRFWVGPAFGL